MTNTQILIVENESIVAESIAIRLTESGYVVAALASSGEQAIQQAAETRPDLVLMDIKLEGEMDGIEAAEEIRTRFDIPVVYLIAYADDNTLERTQITAPFGYIIKPVGVRDLRSTIEMALYKHEMESKLKESKARYRAITKRKRAEEELGKHRGHLEELVEARTAELEKVNEQLQQEIVERIQAEEGQRKALAEALQATHALRESEERYQSLFDRVPLGLYRTTPQGEILDVNPTLAQMLGYPDRETMLAANANDFYLNLEDREQWQAKLERDGVIQGFESQFCRYDGTVIWVWDNARTVRDDQGQILYYEGSLEDITRRKQMEMEVRRRNERLDFLNTISAAAVSSLDADVVMQQILELTCQTLDADGASILLSESRTGGLFFAVIAGDVANALRGAHLAPGQGIAGWVAQHGQSARVSDVRHDPRWHDGLDMITGFQTHSLVCAPLVYHEEITGVIEIVNEHEGELTDDDLSLLEAVASITAAALENARLYMTTRARAENLALLNEMGLALSSTLDPAIVIHAALNQVMRLFQAEGVLLFEPDRQTDELHSVEVLFKPEPAENLVAGLLENDIVEWSIKHGPVLIEDTQSDPRFPDRLDQHSGQVRTLMVVPLRVSKDAVGAIVVVSNEPGIYTREELYTLQTIASTLAVALQNAHFYDTLKVLLEERERTQAHLIQAEKLAALGRLAASLAHEINNPLQALRSGLRLLSTHPPTEEKRQIYLDLVNQEVERLVGIVERVLGFYRPSGEEPEATDVNAVLSETLLLVGKQLEHGRVTVHRQFGAELPPVEAVADQLKQVFLNIILNALNAMPDGGELTVVTDWDVRAREVRIAFTDTGTGIPDDQVSRLFEPFSTSRPDGTGLGLAISYNIVERHGGRIKVESEIGIGSTFIVILPAGAGIAETDKESENTTGIRRDKR